MENRKVLEEQRKLLDEIDSLVIKRKANCTELEIDFNRKLIKVLNNK